MAFAKVAAVADRGAPNFFCGEAFAVPPEVPHLPPQPPTVRHGDQHRRRPLRLLVPPELIVGNIDVAHPVQVETMCAKAVHLLS